jgi:ribulose-phosphate 3-epimerase
MGSLLFFFFCFFFFFVIYIIMSIKSIINPSILAADFANLAADCFRICNCGKVDWLHLDVMDGHFVPNISLGPPIISSLRKQFPKPDKVFDCHMMVSNPLQWVDPIAKAGGDLYCFHLEAIDDIQAVIDAVKNAGMKVGIAIKPGTPIESLLPWIDQLDMALIMTVEPGFGGQKFIPHMMDKVRFLRLKYPDLNIEVDGGLGKDTIDQAAKAGANIIVAGSSVFGAKDPQEVIEVMHTAVEQQLK